MSRSYDIFLSHSGAQKPYVKYLNAELTRLCGHDSVFYDRDAIEHGEQISTSILEYARTCKYFVVVMSEEYFTNSRPPMMELAASYTAGQAENGIPSLPCLFPVFFALRPGHAKRSSTQSVWQERWDTWKLNENMSERTRSRPRQVQPEVWKKALDRLLDTRGPVYYPEEYENDPKVFMTKVAQLIARKLKPRSSSSQGIARLPPDGGNGPPKVEGRRMRLPNGEADPSDYAQRLQAPRMEKLQGNNDNDNGKHGGSSEKVPLPSSVSQELRKRRLTM